MLKPPPLRPGDRVRVIAPAGPFDREGFERGLAVLRERYHPVHQPDIFSQSRYLAGDDARRLAELQAALHDPETSAIFCARGGYGVTRILAAVRLDGAPAKHLIGFSDITALHALLQAQGRSSTHAPVLTQLGRQPRESVDRLFALLESTAAPPPSLTGATTLIPGVVEGPLVGGNLSVLSRLLGTPFLPPLDGAVLLLEDVGERPYRLDRMWHHLAMAGVFKRVRGIALGEFSLCEEKDADYSSADVLRELVAKTGLPCASGFRIGHGDVNLAVPLGLPVRLDATQGALHFLEPACA